MIIKDNKMPKLKQLLNCDTSSPQTPPILSYPKQSEVGKE